MAPATWSITERRLNGLDLGIAVGTQLGVDQDQPVLAADLHAVTGVIDHRHVGVGGLPAAEHDEGRGARSWSKLAFESSVTVEADTAQRPRDVGVLHR